MLKNRLWIALVAIPISLASLLVVGAQRPHLANAGGVIDPTCTNALPCIEYDNKSTGPGVKSTSTKGGGLVGLTTFSSTSTSNGTFGVFGDDASGSGVFNSGIRGASTRGTGVSGSSTSGSGVAGKSSSGIGAFGTSVSGPGLRGNSTTGDGSDGFSGSGTGVVGSSTSGTGVSGSSTNGIGVNGSSIHARGVNGFSTSDTGVTGFSTHSFGVVGTTSGSSSVIAGVEGVSNASTTAILAKGGGGALFVGNNSSNKNVFTVDNAGNMTVARNVSAAFVSGGSDSFTTGIEGLGGTSGVGGGVQGANGDGVGCCPGAIAIRANGFGGPLFVGNGSAGADVFTVDDSGNVSIAGLITTGGSCSVGCARTPGSAGARVISYAPREAEPTMEDFGEGQLVGGQAYVRLDPAFGNAIDQYHNYLVFITPEGDNRGLYVTGKTFAGFTVRESQGGHSTLAFSYRIVAKPFGISEPRLPRMLLVAHPKHRPRLVQTSTLR